MLKNKECVCAKRTSSQANRSETILLNAVVSSELRGDNINNLKCFQTSSYTRAVDSKIYIYIYICVCVVQDEDVMYNIVHVTCGYIYIYIYFYLVLTFQNTIGTRKIPRPIAKSRVVHTNNIQSWYPRGRMNCGGNSDGVSERIRD